MWARSWWKPYMQQMYTSHVHSTSHVYKLLRKDYSTPARYKRQRRFYFKVVLVRYWFFSSVPFSVLKSRFLRFHGTGSGTSVLVPRFWFLLLDTRVSVKGFQGYICICLILELVRFHFGSNALVLEFKLTGTSTAQNFWYLCYWPNTKITWWE